MFGKAGKAILDLASFIIPVLSVIKKFFGLNFLVIVANFCSRTKQRSCVYGVI